MRAAVVGAGPSGFYATDQLLKAGFAVDLYDALPTPFGLVRAVWPPTIRRSSRSPGCTRRRSPSVSGSSAASASGATGHPQGLPSDVVAPSSTRSARRPTTGSGSPAGPAPARDGDQLRGLVNSHPWITDHQFDLNGGRAVVIGDGNVAVDVGRMLVLDPGELAPTDAADHAIDAFGGRDRTRGCPARPPRTGTGIVHQPRTARAR